MYYNHYHQEIINHRKVNHDLLFTKDELNNTINLNNNEIKYLEYWTGSNYKKINNEFQDKNLKHNFKKYNNNLELFFSTHTKRLLKLFLKQNPIKNKRIVFRLYSINDPIKKLNNGDIYERLGFLSTSLFPSNHNSPYILSHIIIPENTSVLNTNIIENFENIKTENEILLLPGQKLKLIQKIINYKDFERNKINIIFMIFEIIGNIYTDNWIHFIRNFLDHI